MFASSPFSLITAEPSASATFFFVLPVQNDGMPHSSASCNTGFRPVAIIRNDFYFVFFQQLFCSYHSRVEAQNTFGFERQAAVEETLREYGYKGKVEVVDNGSDFAGNIPVEQLRRSARDKLRLPSDEFMFLFVGQHIWEKNLEFLLEALAEIRTLPFRMYFIGSGYAASELRRKTEDLYLTDKVIFMGSITERERLKLYYAAADLFLFPSLYDNAPLVVREAAALHTPSLLIKGSTSAEVIHDSVNGFLSDNSVTAYASRISQLLETPQLIAEAGEAASHSIARSWEDVAEEVFHRSGN